MLSALPFYLSSWMTPGWLVASNTLVQKFIVKDLHGAAGQIHKTPYLAGIFSGTAVLVALRWIFVVLPCTLTPPICKLICFFCSNILSTSTFKYNFWISIRNINVLFYTSSSVRSRIYSSTSRNFRTKENCGRTCCSWRI